MNWKEIEVNCGSTAFEYNGSALWNKTFKSVLKFHEPGLAPVLDDSGWYHIGIDGNPIYSQRYNKVFGYYFGRAAVVLNNKWFHIDIHGNRISTQSYAWTGNFQQKICVVRDFKNQYFHIDLDGSRIYSDNYIYCGDFKDGFASVKLSNGLYKHINTNGRFLNDKAFLDLGVFHKNFATAKDKDGWYHIDMDGNEIYQKRFQSIEPFYNGYALVTEFEGNKIIINEIGEIVAHI
jgi:hypothetical protein